MFNYGYSAPGKRSTRCRHVRLVRPRARTHRTWQDGQGHSYLDYHYTGTSARHNRCKRQPRRRLPRHGQG